MLSNWVHLDLKIWYLIWHVIQHLNQMALWKLIRCENTGHDVWYLFMEMLLYVVTYLYVVTQLFQSWHKSQCDFRWKYAASFSVFPFLYLSHIVFLFHNNEQYQAGQLRWLREMLSDGQWPFLFFPSSVAGCETRWKETEREQEMEQVRAESALLVCLERWHFLKGSFSWF